MNIQYCTLTDYAYVTKCLALLESSRLYVEPAGIIDVLALDRAAAVRISDHILRWNHPTVRVSLLSDVIDAPLLIAQQDRTPQEFAFTCGSWWLRRCLARARENTAVVYLDADSCWFGSPNPVFAEISYASIALTPHRFAPEADKSANGYYNVNFVYARNNDTGQAFVDAWTRLCLAWCKNDPQPDGRYADQGYLTDLAHRYPVFDIQNIGVNLAPWNNFQYIYRSEEAIGVKAGHRADSFFQCHYPPTLYVANEQREDVIALYHFHETQVDVAGHITRRTNWPLKEELIELLYSPYEKLLQQVSTMPTPHYSGEELWVPKS